MLLDWMKRHDGRHRLDSRNKWNAGEGDIAEITNRRTWPAVPYWQSHVIFKFGPRVEREHVYVRNEWLYLGRTSAGFFNVRSIRVVGTGKKYFMLEPKINNHRIRRNRYVSIRVRFESPNEDRNLVDLGCKLRIDTTEGVQFVPIM